MYRITPKFVGEDGEYALYPEKPNLWSLEQAHPDEKGWLLWLVVSDHFTEASALAAEEKILNFEEETALERDVRGMLPDLPSALVRVALADLRKVEMDGRYAVDMGDWHQPANVSVTGLCEVCLAGAVCAMTYDMALDARPEVDELPEQDKMTALDDFRAGNIEAALHTLGLELPEEWPRYVEITPYHVGPEAFHADMRNLADALEIYGL